MRLISTISWSAFATVIRLLNGFISIKYVAVIVGPLGVAIIGQFGNFTAIVMVLVLGGITSGIVKYTSEFKNNYDELEKVWHTIVWISGVLIVITFFVLLILHNYLSQKLLHDSKYGSIIIVFAFALVFYVINNMVLNILNGLHEIKKYNLLNSANSTLGLIITIFLVYYYKLYGALLAIVISQSLTCFLIIYFVHNSDWFKLKYFFGKFDKYYFKKLMGFTAMALTSMCVVPVAQIFVRSYLADKISWDISGCWQGLQKISDSYLMVMYVALGTYFLPKFASINNEDEIGNEIQKGYLFLMPFVVISALIIYLLRDFIINLLFAKSFMPMKDMFLWQLLGDCFKVASYFLAYLMQAKAKTRLFITTEVIFGISFPLLSYLFINLLGANGAVMAFCINYFVYFILFIILYKKGYLF